MSPNDSVPRSQSVSRGSRRVIKIIAGELLNLVDQAEQALLEANLGFYQRGSSIVRLGYTPAIYADGRQLHSHRAFIVGEDTLVEAFTVAAIWLKFDARSSRWVECNAPRQIASIYLERKGRWLLPVLTGIINAPTLRADSSILETPGYDAQTGLLLDFGEARFPTIPDQPIKEDALAALQVLLDLVSTFPFVDDFSRAVALSTILTAAIRRTLSAAPMHAFTAPAPGSGKSKLVNLANIIGFGKEPGVMTQGKKEEELEKRLSAALLAGDASIAIDNCDSPLGGEFLCAMLTEPEVRPRVLGRSEAPSLLTGVLVTATGNNLTLLGDLTRRAIMCRLDAVQERPELRQFACDPVIVAQVQRGKFLIATLTILRAYHLAGLPERPPTLGSFGSWSDWVRGSLLWLGQADPVGSVELIRQADPALIELTALGHQLHITFGDRKFRVRDIIDRANAVLPPSAPRPNYANPDLREVLLNAVDERGELDSRKVAGLLKRHKERVANGRRLVHADAGGGNVQHWRLEAVPQLSPEN